MQKLKEISIHGIHGNKNFKFPIHEGKLVLVGQNGFGKTTIMSILYLVLSRQWTRLSSYEFDHINFTLSDETITITKNQVDFSSFLSLERKVDIVRRILPLKYGNIRRYPEAFDDILIANNPKEFEPLVEKYDVPIWDLQRIQKRIKQQLSELFQNDSNLTDELERVKSLDIAIKRITNDAHVLYLPTYRRIEKDLESIFPKMEESIKRFNQTSSTTIDPRQSPFTELIEFGMDDVQSQFETASINMRETARSQLNNLTSSYLREIIRDQAGDFEMATINSLEPDIIEKILRRVDDKNLTDLDKEKLRAVIHKMKKVLSKRNLKHYERYTAHYFLKLLEIHNSLTRLEARILDFISTCNAYLNGKFISYNDQDFSINLLLNNNKPVQLRDLSSGEKQIVSLFSHLFLGDYAKYILIIDEPELSLSIPWQTRLLPDINKSNKCSFFATATHSPFIFQTEEFDKIAIDLETHILGEA